MNRFKWFLVFLISIALLVFGGWMYRVNLIQSSLPYLLKDILTQAGIDVFQVELNDISIDKTSLKSLSFEVDAAGGDGRNETVKVLFRDVELQYQYQSLLKGRLDTVVIGQVMFSAMDSQALNSASSVETDGLFPPLEKNKKEVSLALFHENLNILRNDWRSLIPMEALTVDKVVFHGNLFSVLENYEFELSFDAGENNMHLDIVGNDESNLHAIEVRSHVRDEWLFSFGRSKVAFLKLRLSDESIAATYFFDAEKAMVLLKQNNLGNMGDVDVSGLFNGELIFYFNEPLLNDNKYLSSFSMHADQLNVRGGGIVNARLSDVNMNLGFQYEWFADYKELVLLKESHISFSLFNYAGTQLISAPLFFHGMLQIKYNSWFYDGDLSIASLDIKKKIDKQTLEVAFKNLSANVIVDSERLNVSGGFEPAVVPAVVSYRLSHSLMNGEGDLFLHSDEPLNLSNEKSLSQILKPWLYPFDVFSGEVYFDTHLRWYKTKALQLTTKARLKNIGGVFNELVFSGLSTRQSLTLLPALETMKFNDQTRVGQTGLIKLDYIDAGVLISDLNFQFALRKQEQGSLPVFEVHNFNAQLLGGHFSAQRFTLDFNQSVNNLSIRVSQLDLSRVAETQQFAGLEIEGFLDGVLPVEINKEGVFVQEAYFHNADRQGVIRYQPDISVEQLVANPLSEIALKALRDFRYDKLSAKLSYVPDGTFSLGLEMNGLSPELENGRKVNLNINTEQNLKSLLKSIRFSQGLSDSIDKRVRKKYSAMQ